MNVSLAKVIKVIKVIDTKGTGIEEDPVREVIQYWDLKGHLLAEKDEWLERYMIEK